MVLNKSICTFSTFDGFGLDNELVGDCPFSSFCNKFNTLFIGVEIEWSETSLEYCSS